MPTEKFDHLQEAKKQLIVDAMREEFLVHTYSELRVSSIIKRAGISRASFYLYFEDKDDLFVYMLEESDRRLKTGLKQSLLEEHGVFLNAYERMLDRLLEEDEGLKYQRVVRRAIEDESSQSLALKAERRATGIEPRTAFALECEKLMNRSLYPRLDDATCICAAGMGVTVLVQALTMKACGAEDAAVRDTVHKQLEILEKGLRA